MLVNNAGLGFGSSREGSHDGLELRFQVNYLAGYFLAGALQPSRVINVASAGQAPIDFDDPMITRGYSGDRAYCQSKLAQIMHAFDLAEAGVTANALHPATFMPTKMVVDAGIDPISSLERWRRLALVRRSDVSGAYFNGLDEARADAQAYVVDARARLRALSDAYLGGESSAGCPRRDMDSSTASPSTCVNGCWRAPGMTTAICRGASARWWTARRAC